MSSSEEEGEYSSENWTESSSHDEDSNIEYSIEDEVNNGIIVETVWCFDFNWGSLPNLLDPLSSYSSLSPNVLVLLTCDNFERVIDFNKRKIYILCDSKKPSVDSVQISESFFLVCSEDNLLRGYKIEDCTIKKCMEVKFPSPVGLRNMGNNKVLLIGDPEEGSNVRVYDISECKTEHSMEWDVNDPCHVQLSKKNPQNRIYYYDNELRIHDLKRKKSKTICKEVDFMNFRVFLQELSEYLLLYGKTNISVINPRKDEVTKTFSLFRDVRCVSIHNDTLFVAEKHGIIEIFNLNTGSTDDADLILRKVDFAEHKDQEDFMWDISSIGLLSVKEDCVKMITTSAQSKVKITSLTFPPGIIKNDKSEESEDFALKAEEEGEFETVFIGNSENIVVETDLVEKHETPVRSILAFDMKIVISASSDGKINVFNLDSQEVIQIGDFIGPVNGLIKLSKRSFLACSEDSFVRGYKFNETHDKVERFLEMKFKKRIFWMLSLDGNNVVIGMEDEPMVLFNVDQQKLMKKFKARCSKEELDVVNPVLSKLPGPPRFYYSVLAKRGASKDLKKIMKLALLSGKNGSIVKLYDVRLRNMQSSKAMFSYLDKNGEEIVVFGESMKDGTFIRFFNTQNETFVKEISTLRMAVSMCMIEKKYLLVGESFGFLEIFGGDFSDLEKNTSETFRAGQFHSDGIIGIQAISSNNSKSSLQFATASDDCSVKISNVSFDGTRVVKERAISPDTEFKKKAFGSSSLDVSLNIIKENVVGKDVDFVLDFVVMNPKTMVWVEDDKHFSVMDCETFTIRKVEIGESEVSCYGLIKSSPNAILMLSCIDKEKQGKLFQFEFDGDFAKIKKKGETEIELESAEIQEAENIDLERLEDQLFLVGCGYVGSDGDSVEARIVNTRKGTTIAMDTTYMSDGFFLKSKRRKEVFLTESEGESRLKTYDFKKHKYESKEVMLDCSGKTSPRSKVISLASFLSTSSDEIVIIGYSYTGMDKNSEIHKIAVCSRKNWSLLATIGTDEIASDIIIWQRQFLIVGTGCGSLDIFSFSEKHIAKTLKRIFRAQKHHTDEIDYLGVFPDQEEIEELTFFTVSQDDHLKVCSLSIGLTAGEIGSKGLKLKDIGPCKENLDVAKPYKKMVEKKRKVIGMILEDQYITDSVRKYYHQSSFNEEFLGSEFDVFYVTPKMLYVGKVTTPFAFKVANGFGFVVEEKTSNISFLGVFKNGYRNGMGKEIDLKLQGKKRTIRQSTIYEGDFKNGRREGIGILHGFTKKSDRYCLYEGTFKNGKKNGRGEFYDIKAAEYINGVWEDGILQADSIFKFDFPKYDLKKFKKHLIQQNLIGTGAYGKIFKVKSSVFPQIKAKDCKFFAVKVMESEDIDTVDDWERGMKRGIECVSRIKDKTHIMETYGFFRDGCYLGCVMEWCKTAVDTFITHRRNTLKLDQKIKILHETAKGIKELHDLGIMHRDLKWANVLLSEDLTVKVCDFDSLRENEQQFRIDSVELTNRGIAPEVYSGKEYDLKCDVFSFGVMVFSLLLELLNPYSTVDVCSCGLTFDSISKSKSLDHHISTCNLRPRIDPSKHPNIPGYLVEFCQECVDSDPSQRPSMAEVVKFFREILSEKSWHCVLKLELPCTEQIKIKKEVFLSGKVEMIRGWIQKDVLPNRNCVVSELRHRSCGEVKKSENIRRIIEGGESSPLLDVEVSYVHSQLLIEPKISKLKVLIEKRFLGSKVLKLQHQVVGEIAEDEDIKMITELPELKVFLDYSKAKLSFKGIELGEEEILIELTETSYDCLVRKIKNCLILNDVAFRKFDVQHSVLGGVRNDEDLKHVILTELSDQKEEKLVLELTIFVEKYDFDESLMSREDLEMKAKIRRLQNKVKELSEKLPMDEEEVEGEEEGEDKECGKCKNLEALLVEKNQEIDELEEENDNLEDLIQKIRGLKTVEEIQKLIDDKKEI